MKQIITYAAVLVLLLSVSCVPSADPDYGSPVEEDEAASLPAVPGCEDSGGAVNDEHTVVS